MQRYNPTDYAVVDWKARKIVPLPGGTRNNTTGVTPTGSEASGHLKGKLGYCRAVADDVMEMVVTIAPGTPVVFSGEERVSGNCNAIRPEPEGKRKGS